MYPSPLKGINSTVLSYSHDCSDAQRVLNKERLLVSASTRKKFPTYPNDFWHKRKMDYFDPYNVLLAIATNILVLLMTAFVLQGLILPIPNHINVNNYYKFCI